MKAKARIRSRIKTVEIINFALSVAALAAVFWISSGCSKAKGDSKDSRVSVGTAPDGSPVYKGIDIDDDALPPDLAARLYNGTKAEPGELPEVVWIGMCTATILTGGEDIVTAGHCVSSGQRVRVTGNQGQNYGVATCTRHPQYNDRTVFNDYALCRLEQKIEGHHTACLETREPVKVGDTMLLTGYGRPNLQKLYHGKSKVSQIRSQDIITNGPAVLGSGDSGGPLFFLTDVLTDKETRRIAAPNSRAGGSYSYFNRWTDAPAVAYVADYERRYNVQIECHDIDPKPPVPPPPPGGDADCPLLYVHLGRCMKLPAVTENTCHETYQAFASCMP